MKTYFSTLNIIAAIITVLFLGYMLAQLPSAKAGALSFTQATVATTSQIAVSNTPILVFATTTLPCASRVISTYASPVMITFTDKQGVVPNGQFGFLQAASTTVAYDSGLYGCEAVRIYSFSSQTITVSENR